MLNAARSPTFYEFDSTELLALYKDLWARDEEPVVIYHSHTATEAYPSRTDISYAGEPGAHYVLISTRDPQVEEIRSYRIVDGAVARPARSASWCTHRWQPIDDPCGSSSRTRSRGPA